jgi:hypothetical protein
LPQQLEYASNVKLREVTVPSFPSISTVHSPPAAGVRNTRSQSSTKGAGTTPVSSGHPVDTGVGVAAAQAGPPGRTARIQPAFAWTTIGAPVAQLHAKLLLEQAVARTIMDASAAPTTMACPLRSPIRIRA